MSAAQRLLRRASPITALGLLALLAGCADEPIVAPLRYEAPPPPPDEAFRATAPPASPTATFAPTAFREASLANGLRVVVLERHALPIVSIRLVVSRGAADASTDRGAYTLLSRVMGSATARHNERELNDAWANLGAQYRASFGNDGCWLGARVETPSFDTALSLLAETVMTPRLADKDIADARRTWLRDDEDSRYDTSTALWKNVATLLFGASHPYGYARPDRARAHATGTEAVSALHASFFQPAHATLIIAGDVTAEAAGASVARWFGAWSAAGPEAARAVVPPAAAPASRIVLVNRSDRAQVRVAVLAPLPVLTEDELAAVDVFAAALGGLASPLRRTVREESGAAYSFGAEVQTYRQAAYGVVAAAIERPQAITTLRTILAAIADARQKGVAPELVEGARAGLLAAWRARVSRTDGLAQIASDATARGVSIEEALSYPNRLAAVTPEVLHRVAERYFADQALRLVVVGDAKGLKDLGSLGLGPVELRNESAEPVTRK